MGTQEPTKQARDFNEKTEPNTPSKVTREQRRRNEDIVKAAKIVYNNLYQKFFDFIINHDNPLSDEVKERLTELCAQWIMYCKAKKLSSDSFGILERFGNEKIEEYRSLIESAKKLQLEPSAAE